MTSADVVQSTVTKIATRLSQPDRRQGPAWQQSLAAGAVGVALLHIERARTNDGDWSAAHAWLTSAASGGVNASAYAGLYNGAPAVAFALHHAAAHTDRYHRALRTLDAHVAAVTHTRIARAHGRMDRGVLPRLDEFDVVYGLTGIGAHLLKHAPGSSAFEQVLRYLVRLTDPLRIDGETLPGWWTGHAPDFTDTPAFPDGHGNLGLAHGITGPLALLALAKRAGHLVDRHDTAIQRICGWLDTWRQDADTGPWWPQWITRRDLHRGHPTQTTPLRPSWCYGTPGIARAQQLAALATGDTTRQDTAERTLDDCLTHLDQLPQLTGTGICHGWAGLLLTTRRAAADARTPAVATHLTGLTDKLLARHDLEHDGDVGLLEGNAGIALALLPALCNTPSVSGWDTCLLLA